MKKLSVLGAVAFGVIAVVLAFSLSGCQTSQPVTRNNESSAFDRPTGGSSCGFG
jgi:uncharacterized lipoprotein YehR (DUF1307 family)